MNTETIVAPEAETLTTAADSTDTPVVEQGATDDAGQKAESAEQAKTPEELSREIEDLRKAIAERDRKITKRDRTAGKMHAELEQFRQIAASAKPPENNMSADDDMAKTVHREALTLAQQIAEEREFATRCNTIAAAGQKSYPDFDSALKVVIEEAGQIVGPNGKPTALGELIIEADAPAALIHYLGKNPEVAAELDGLSAAKLARKLVAIEAKMAEKPKVSAAPKPLEPVRGLAATNDPSAMSDAEFSAWRRSSAASSLTSSLHQPRPHTTWPAPSAPLRLIWWLLARLVRS